MSDPPCSSLVAYKVAYKGSWLFSAQLFMHPAQHLQRLKEQELPPQAGKGAMQISDNTWEPR